MSLDEAVASLEKHLADPETFVVFGENEAIVVNVNFIYRVQEIRDLGTWEGFPVVIQRRSCW